MIADDIKGAYNRTKWALVFRGLLWIALGLVIFTRPLPSVEVLALVIAFWALADGLVNIVHAFDLRRVAPHWWVMLLSGLVGVGFGLAAFYYYPALSLSFVVIWTALWLLTAGALGVYLATQERRAQLAWGWTLTFGVIALIAGVLAIAFPAITIAALMTLLAVFGILGGIALLVGAGKMQSIQQDLHRAVSDSTPFTPSPRGTR